MMRKLAQFKPLLCLLTMVGVGFSSLPAHAESSTINWYRWYRDLHGYLGSVGGVLCEPGTALSFHMDGSITALSRDGTCLASLANLHYPLPKNAPINRLSLPIRRRSNFPLSHRALNQMVSNQMQPAPLELH